MAFELRIPGGKGGSSGNKSNPMKETNTLLKKLDKSIMGTLDVWEMLSSLIGDTFKLLQPMVKLLSLLIFIAFLPLLPIILLLTKGLAMLVKLFTGGFGNVAKMIGKILLGLLLIVIAFLLAPFVTAGAAVAAVFAILILGIMFLADGLADFVLWIGEFIGKAGEWLYEAFLVFIDWIVSGAIWIWEKLKGIGQWFVDAGVWLWEKIKIGFEFFKEIGTKIWEIIKVPFEWLKDMFKNIINSIINLLNGLPLVDIPLLANGGIVTKPTLAVVGEAGPEAVIPLGKMGGMGTTININNPIVREDADIRKLTDSISKELQRRGNRGFSNG